LVRLDLSRSHAAFRVFNILRAVSTLSRLKTFHFPQEAAVYSDSDVVKDNERVERTPKWPDSLETFCIPCSLDPGFIRAFEKAPASLINLVVEDGERQAVISVLESVFKLIGSRIRTLKLEYYGRPTGKLANYLIKFPNLTHLSVRPSFISEDAMDQIYHEIDHPLCSITVKLDNLYGVFGITGLHHLLDERRFRLPNIASLLLSSSSSLDDWVSFSRKESVPLTYMGLCNISSFLKSRSSSASGLKENGVWVVDSKKNDTTICEFTEENLKIRPVSSYQLQDYRWG
jgi:hypothetical protein